MNNDIFKRANHNLVLLSENIYPGRGIIVGMDETGEYLVQLYWIMGRGENSRNRIFITGDDYSVATVAVDPSKVEDPNLIFYTAMAQQNLRSQGRASGDIYVVSNGHQTMDAISYLQLDEAIKKWEYEPDSPNFTPRITARFKNIYSAEMFSTEISILKKSPVSRICYRTLFNPTLKAGFGYCITTYSGDGNPLPSFEGEPYLLPLLGNIETVTNTVWDALNEENRVSLAVKFIKISKEETILRIINKYTAVV